MPVRFLPYPLLLIILLLQTALPAETPVADTAAGLRLETDSAVYTAHGNSVLQLDPDSEAVLWRKAVSGQVTLLEQSADGVSVVTSLPGGLSERISLDADGRASSQVRFSTDPAVFASLRQEAAQVPDPAAALDHDPTNPWLYLLASGQLDDEEAAAELRSEAVARATTFYDLAGLAAELVSVGDYGLAGEAMQLSLQDFARRGYDPALLTDLELHAAYGFPLPHLAQAHAAADAEAAAFWASWLEAFLTPQVPGVRAALTAHADWLAARGDSLAARDWRERLRPDRSELAVSGVERLFSSLGRSGWYMFASLIFVIIALMITLTLKYWEPQSLAMRRSLETGGRASVLQRFLAIRFFSTTEKLVLALLYVAGFGILGLTSWAERAAGVPPAVAAGTVASAEALDQLDDLPLLGERGQFIRGYVAQIQGNAGAAALHYRAAPRYGPALNNLAVLQDEPELFREAQLHAPALSEVDWNLGDTAMQPLFDRRAGLSRPALVVPDQLDFRAAVMGGWQQALSGYYLAPLAAFTMNVPWLASQWIWYVLLGLYVLLGVVTVLWLAVPRPRMARNAPRSFGYHLLAVLVPGSGMADELWGILLLVPWGLFGVDLLWRLWAGSPLLDVSLATLLTVLAVLYAVNLAAFIVEFISYRRRMRLLFRRNPEAGVAYGKRIEAN